MNDNQTAPKKKGSIFGVLVFWGIVAAVAYFYFSDDDDKRKPVVLYDEIISGNIALDVSGDGRTSGPVLKGYLINRTPQAKIVNVNLVAPFQLINSDSSAQNMMVTRVYRYHEADKITSYKDNNAQYINMRGNEHIPVVFIAYCMDYDKSAPDETDRFTVVQSLPVTFLQLAKQVKEYRADNEGADVIDAMQVAVWHRKDIEVSDMKKRLAIDSEDIKMANEILRQ